MKVGIADSENTSIAMQRHDEYVSMVTNNHAATEELFSWKTSL
jgi:hypothetical protein